ncbi:MAG TPA: prolyl oligopeptidase family serine peptidase [Gemmatimonadaceae bacterium]|nr:prolyl oligopeptidase family serine peptidase [Gemmatimonadaceae bacterium]
MLPRRSPLAGSLAFIAAPVLLLQPLAARAQATATAPAPAHNSSFQLTVPSIMRGEEIVGRAPERVRWTPDGRWIYFYWLEPGTDWRKELEPYRVRAVAGATPEHLTEAQMDSAGPLIQPGVRSRDGRLRAVAYEGDIYLVDLHANSARRVTQTIAREGEPAFSADGRQIYFVRDDNVFAIDLANGAGRQLTDIRRGKAPKDSAAAKGQRGFLERQQRELFEVIRDRAARDSLEKAERARRDSLHAATLYLGDDERIARLAVSPTGRGLLLVTRTDARGARRTEIPEYVTASGYTDDIAGRTKVGDVQSEGRAAYMSLPDGKLRWLHVIPDDTASNAAMVDVLGWNDAGTSALLFAVAPNYKTRYIERVDADSASLHTLDILRDSAWVDGPCFGCGGWYDGGKRLWFVSEADGWAHLYTMAADGSDRRQLTKGRWEVTDVAVSYDKRSFYLHTSEASPFEQHFYRMSVDGGARTRITTRVGGHDATLSPDESMLADVFSEANRPPELFVMRNRPGAEMAQLTTSPTAEWLSFPWIKPEIVWVTASDGVKVPARIYRPSDLGAKPNGAGVIFVHGAGYLHNVKNYWSDYYREYMFNHLLASKGYVVLDMDYRGSAGYGRDWRTAIYRHMGGRDLQDEVDGSRYLGLQFGIPPERVGIYGGSYGGFMTLMALFTEPQWFGAGAALRSVTDWAHYNHPYTARILNQPQDDSVAYTQSSPIYFADGLQDPLLMAHGMVDTNVHFEDIVRLTQRLIELHKTGWELAVYPVENHGFVRPSSWTDEYTRILELFDRTIGKAQQK